MIQALSMHTALGRQKSGNHYATPAECAITLSEGLWWEAPHLKLISDKIAMMREKPIRLIVTLPPRHGKSELVSHWTPVWFLNEFPDRKVILASYEADFAAFWGRKARNAIQENESRLEIQVRQDSSAASRWELKQGGGMWTAGVGGPITGKGAHLLIIDDPIKNYAEAYSATYREAIEQWYQTTAYTRLEPGASIITIMCMTGDTPVLMADGMELPLREIKAGDHVATYDNGKLAASTVLNHRSNGLDSVCRIKTTCGKLVHANERHPFLVEEHGELKWIRLKNLTTAHKIVTLKGNGANGRERLASLMDVRNQLAHGVIVPHITTRRCGQTGIAQHHATQRTDVICASSSGTELLPRNTMRCTKHKMANVLYATSHQGTMYAHIGVVNCALTTATKRIRSEDFCVMTVTLPWDMPKQQKQLSLLLHTSDFTTTQIESIDPVGIKEVFDLQVERTGNFIANGLVSHNTRWHNDDLVGRLLEKAKGEWDVVNLPAQAEKDDLLEREEGQALWPERYDNEALDAIAEAIGGKSGRNWLSLYQQRPVKEGGNILKAEWWQYYSVAQPYEMIGQYWDTAFKKGAKTDYSVCVTLGRHQKGINVIDVYRSKLEFPELLRQVIAQYNLHKPNILKVEDAASGTPLIQTLTRDTRLPIIPISVTESKEIRASRITGIVEAGRVFLPGEAEWLSIFLEEMTTFPAGVHDDIVDAFVEGIADIWEYGKIPLPKEGKVIYDSLQDFGQIAPDPDDYVR